MLLQSATAILLQRTTSVITKCDRYYKVRQFYYKVRPTGITKCDGYYKVRQNREHIGKDHIEEDPVRSNYSKTMERGQEGKKPAAGAAERDFSDISYVQI